MKTLYISDLDDTLLQPNIELSEETITTLNHLIEHGMYFSVATARSIASVRPILKDITPSVPVIIMNGVCIFDLVKNNYVKIEALSESNIKLLLSLIKEHQLKGFAYTVKDGVLSTYYEDLSSKAMVNFVEERVTKYQKVFQQVQSFDLLKKEPLIYYSLMDEKEKLEPIYYLLQEIEDLNSTFYKDNYTPNLWYLEIYAKTASKYHAVQFIREQYNFDRIVCFGDNRNDIPLFEASDLKLAVENAVDELKEKADLIIGSNTQDGVAR